MFVLDQRKRTEMEKIMNILIVNTFYYPNMVGGAEHSVKLLAENLVNAGHDVSVYTLDGKRKQSAVLEHETINGVYVYRGHDVYFDREKHFHAKNYIEKVMCRLSSIQNKRIKKDLDYLMTQVKPDVVHTNGIYGISTYVWEYFHKHNVKVVYTIRDYFLFDPTARVGGTKSFLLNIYQNYFRRKSCRYVDIVTAPSKFTLDVFTQNGYFRNAKKKCVVNSIDFKFEDVEQIVEEKLARKANIVIFLFVGALTHNKGVDNLLEAFQLVNSENIRLWLCGEGPLEKLVKEAQIQDKRICYKGQLAAEKLKTVYREADVLIAPSTWDEPFGRIIIEGNQYGLTVIGSNKAGIAEILAYMKTGEVIDPNCITEIADRIKCFSNREYYSKYIKNIPQNLSRYSVKRQIEDFAALYKAN